MTGWASLTARRPWTTLAVVAVLLTLSAVGIHRMSADTSFQGLMPKGDPAADAAGHLLRDFAVTDSLLVMATADHPDPAGLLAFADRFDKAIRSSPLVEAVDYRPAAGLRPFVEQKVFPAGIYYLSEDRYAAAKQRLTLAGMRRQLDRDQTMLSAPGAAAGALSSVLLKDPLRLSEFLTDEFHARTPAGFGGSADGLFSPDGRGLLIRVIGRRSLDDLPAARQLTEAATSAANTANTANFHLDLSGGYAIATRSEQAIRHDLILSVTSSVVLLQLLFIAGYRKPFRSFLLAFVPVAAGLVIGFGFRAAWSSTIAPAAAVVGAILAGMGIDYTVLYLPHYQSARAEGLDVVAAVDRTTRRLAGPLTAACVTSIVGFVAIGWSSVPALEDFALVGTLGLIGSMLATLTVLPALLALFENRRPTSLARLSPARTAEPRFRLEPLLIWVGRRRPAFIASWTAALLVLSAATFLKPGPMLPLESDLTNMHPRPNPPLDAEAVIARRMGFDPGAMQVYLTADSAAHLVSLSYEVSKRLDSLVFPHMSAENQAFGEAVPGLVGTYGLSTWLPDPTVADRRRREFSPAQVDAILADFHTAVADSPFDPAAFTGYETYLRLLLGGKMPAPTIDDLTPYPRLAETLLDRDALAGHPTRHEAIQVLLFDRPLDSRADRQTAVVALNSALQGLPGATVTGLGVVGLSTEQTVRHDLPRMLVVALILHAILLPAHFRGFRSALLSVIPAFVGLLTVAAVYRLGHVALNMVNLISIPMLIGISVDYGIYVVSLARPRDAVSTAEARTRFVTSGHSVLISAVANVLGFGSLVTVSVPAIRSLGYVVGLGVLACFLATLFLLGPILVGESITTAATNKS